MPIEILMPALSPTMTEGNLARWLKQEGDEVSPGDVIAEIETDKATMEVEAVEAGRLGRILIGDGTEGVAVNTPIALLLEEDEDASALDGAAAKAKPAAPAAPAAEPAAAAATPRVAREAAGTGNGADRGGRIFASPLARRMAEQAGIELGGLQGSGPHGRIIKIDIERAIQQGAAPKPAAAAPQPAARAEAGGSNSTVIISTRSASADSCG
jgi:pyruvate dehydrogenase E2 component (dihydrolipoamide acetyltransferase)